MLTHLKELFRFRDLWYNLALRDIKVRYRQTLIGVAWAVVQPLAFMLIFTLIFSRFGRVSSDGLPYPIFSYAGLVPWTFFATGLSLAVTSVSGNMNLVKKIYFPREVFPLATVTGCLVDFFIAGFVVAGLMIWYRIPVTPQVLWLPWLVGVEIVLLLALALMVSAWNVFYRDIKYIIPLTVQLGMFVTPVIYSTSMVPEDIRHWYMLNPMAAVIDGFRRVLLYGQPPQFQPMLVATGVAVVLVVLAYAYFKRVEVKFSDLI